MAMTPSPQSLAANPLVAQARNALSNVMRMGDQPALRRAMPAVMIMVATGLALAGWLLLREPSRMVLYPGLPEAEKSRVYEALTAAQIDATVNQLTGEVEVATADFHRAKMQLASQGLPEAMPDGDTVLADLPMGASRSVEAARLRQVQEMELARSITEIASVQGARVHLALPEKSAFLRDQEPPRASVFLQLAAGRVMEQAQVEAVVNLVSSSVPGMARGDVTVVDQMGRLLSRGSDDAASLVTDRQLQQRLEVEKLYRQRIESLLTPIAGAGNLSVQVTVDMDFTQSSITEERVDPNGSAIKTEQTEETESTDSGARGIPGAVSNAPPNQGQLQPAQTAPVNQPVNGAKPVPTNRTAGTTRSFEVSRTVQTTQPATAVIRKVSAAILMRALPQAAVAEGEPVPPALPEALKADLERLAQSAIGFDATRGDSVVVMAQPFMEEAIIADAPTDWSWLPDASRQFGMIALIAIVALGIIRPLLTRSPMAAEALPNGQATVSLGGVQGVEVAEGDSLDDVQARLEARRSKLTQAALGSSATREEKFAVLRQIAAEDPARIASVLQRMMKDELDTTAS
ncbi:flagellar basal-body MS-ring/collar protein FliF [Paragemmobacter straminiformis]|uniref:Flagellar M-ring protein n=1 Tax=Paragemmobacter straminiformis TaxID=2045119 RepID=A0A842I5E4_9RHOB|nr:flagellar basal-body MS-ring/collar protein FliF [Gemmobacter straminiformis]MBC2834781.1 flagellar M-ring protein FliF [Gemmobacter straminiformis]